MPRSSLRWSPLATLAGLLLTIGALTGCPGSLDPGLMGEPPATGAGGSMGSGGTTGTGGGMSSNCTGDNDGATIVTSLCSSACHNPQNEGSIGGGLDLTIDANIKTRLVGVKSPSTSSGGAMCSGNQTPYLNAGSKPATGLLIDKVKPSPPCGVQMPQIGAYLTSVQQQCLIDWATTLTSP